MPLVPNDTDGAITRSRIQSYITANFVELLYYTTRCFAVQLNFCS